jgi:hypothetical protein
LAAPTEGSSINFLADAIAKPIRENEGGTHVYVGESHSIGSLLVDLAADGTRKAQHLLVPRSTAKALQPEDLTYLKEKGAFSLPTDLICNALVQSYFEHVHPTTPIIDKTVFLIAFNEGGVQRVNLLLLWSMFSASASFTPESVVQDAGYTNRIQMKESFLARAKSLFHLSGEDEKIVLIQSALLISFWFSDAEDVMQTWYWTGIAFGLAQTMGLHRDPVSANPNSSVPEQHRKLWRRIWWNCVIRDSWVALLMGRPMRIQSEDCDCPPPTEADFSDDGRDPNTIELVRLWLSLLELTKTLREILILNYRPRVEIAATRIDALESLINQNSEDVSPSSPISPLLTFHRLQLVLYRQVALIALFQPYCRHPALHAAHSLVTIPPKIAANKVKDAASQTTEILEKIISMDGIKYFGPTTVSLLPPAMQAHLMQSRSSTGLASRLANLKLDVCLMVLAELRNNYPSACILHDLFTAATMADTPLSHRVQHSVSSMQAATQNPTETEIEELRQEPVQGPVFTTPDTGSDIPFIGGLLQDAPQAPLVDNDFPFSDLSLFPSLNPAWPAEADLALEVDLNAMLSPDELGAFFG